MMRKLGLTLVAALALCAQARAQTLTTMFRFDYTDGANTIWKPVADGQGNLYGTTERGGAGHIDGGTLYKFTPGVSRSFETLHSFAGGPDGALPTSGPAYDASTGMLYGTTEYGGVTGDACFSVGCGTIFSFNPATDAYATVHAFAGGAGGVVVDDTGPLALGSDGALYGVALNYADTSCSAVELDCSLAYKFDPGTGSFTTLHEFSLAEGTGPIGGLVFGKAGKLFGLMQRGTGSVYKLDPVSGAGTTIYEFPPFVFVVGLAVDDAKNLYVTTRLGGTNQSGSIVKLTPNVGEGYTVTTLFDFDAGPSLSGRDVRAALTYDNVKQVLYGTAYRGGVDHVGTLFQINPDGSGFTVLHNFTGGVDAGYPEDAVVISLGKLYGGTAGWHSENPHRLPQCDRTNGCGTLYEYPRF